MAVVLYRNGNEERFPADQLSSALDQGWTVEPESEDAQKEYSGYVPAALEEETETQAATKPEPEEEQLDITGSAEIDPDLMPLTNDKVRKMAKEKGITEWETARIRTLKSQLGIS